MKTYKNLVDIQPGTKVCICDISKVNSIVLRRLIDLGIMEGTEICMKRRSPFGGPLTLEANGQSIGIRRNEASMIEVQFV
ncbi:FeoA family protein [Brevibacillus sp. SYSU BS000544]|uniref:FeoA family protein n=1 Tax=Brevibacillus sp. SYSU BS000544 TaxID=3416443 RepID=UPI003CE493F1